MANGFYAKPFRQLVEANLGSNGGWDGDTFSLYLVDASDYSADLANHDFLDDVAGAALEEGPVTIGTRTVLDDGIIDGDDVVFTSAAGDPCEALLCVDRSPATDATRPLFFYIDTATGLPVTLGGGNVTVTWDNGANRIAKL